MSAPGDRCIALFSGGIPDIQGLSSIDVHATQAYGIRKISHIPITSFGSNANDNAYSTSLRHAVWNMDQKMIIMGIDLCYNTF